MNDYTALIKSLVDKMLEPHGVDYNYVMSNTEIEGKRWYQHFTWTNKQFDEFKTWAIEEIKNHEQVSKEIAKKKFGYFNLQYGLRIVESK